MKCRIFLTCSQTNSAKKIRSSAAAEERQPAICLFRRYRPANRAVLRRPGRAVRKAEQPKLDRTHRRNRVRKSRRSVILQTDECVFLKINAYICGTRPEPPDEDGDRLRIPPHRAAGGSGAGSKPEFDKRMGFNALRYTLKFNALWQQSILTISRANARSSAWTSTCLWMKTVKSPTTPASAGRFPR